MGYPTLAMSFQLRCPKCGSTSAFEIRSVPRRFGESTDARMFSCRCGRQLFADQIDKEIERQMAEYVPSSNLPLSETVTERIRREKEEEIRAIKERMRLREVRAEEERKRQEEAEKKFREDFYGGTLGVSYDAGQCAWRDCTHSSRENSKYCSRDCSNKNARWRHQNRQAR